MQATTEPRLLFPGLRGFYERLVPLSWPLIRCACGLILVVHGWGKVSQGAGAYIPAFIKMGYANPTALIWLLAFVEFVGGLCIALGLFTRLFAAMVTVEMAVIMFAHYLPNGFAWTNRGYEFVLMWGLVAMAIWWRGGGPYSLDRRMGVEL